MSAAVIDLGAIVEAAMRPLCDEVRALRAELVALREQRTAEVLGSSAMAVLFGKPSVEAFNRWVSRPSGEHVRAIAKLDAAGRRYWLRAEVQALATRGVR